MTTIILSLQSNNGKDDVRVWEFKHEEIGLMIFKQMVNVAVGTSEDLVFRE